MANCVHCGGFIGKTRYLDIDKLSYCSYNCRDAAERKSYFEYRQIDLQKDIRDSLSDLTRREELRIIEEKGRREKDEVEKINRKKKDFISENGFFVKKKIEKSLEELSLYNAKNKEDEIVFKAAQLVAKAQQGSTSMLQRKLKIDYSRACKIIDQLEAAGIIGPFQGSKAREVLIPDEETLESLFEDKRNKDIKEQKVLKKAANFVVLHQDTSIYFLQNALNCDAFEVSRILDKLEKVGIVGPESDMKPREVLISDEESLDKYFPYTTINGQPKQINLFTIDDFFPSPPCDIIVNYSEIEKNLQQEHDYGLYDPTLDLSGFKPLKNWKSIVGESKLTKSIQSSLITWCLASDEDELRNQFNLAIVCSLIEAHPSVQKIVSLSTNEWYSKLNCHFNLGVLDDSSKHQNEIESNGEELDIKKCLAIYQELLNRFELLKLSKCSNISLYNRLFSNRQLDPNLGHKYLPEIIVVIPDISLFLRVCNDFKFDWLTRISSFGRDVGIRFMIGQVWGGHCSTDELLWREVDHFLLSKDVSAGMKKFDFSSLNLQNNDLLSVLREGETKTFNQIGLDDKYISNSENDHLFKYFNDQRGYPKETNTLPFPFIVSFDPSFAVRLNKSASRDKVNSLKPGSGIPEKLIELKEMLENELITKEEFLTLKKDLFSC